MADHRKPDQQHSSTIQNSIIVGQYFQIIRKIGEGNFGLCFPCFLFFAFLHIIGAVFSCIDIRNNHHFAAKVEVFNPFFLLLIVFLALF